MPEEPPAEVPPPTRPSLTAVLVLGGLLVTAAVLVGLLWGRRGR